MRRLQIGLVILLIAVLVVPALLIPLPVAAQSPTPTPWYCLYDFSLGAEGWSPITWEGQPAAVHTASGWTQFEWNGGYGYYSVVYIGINGFTATTVTRVKATYDLARVGEWDAPSNTVNFTVGGADSGSQSTAAGTGVVYDQSGLWSADNMQFGLTSRDATGYISSLVRTVEVWGTGTPMCGSPTPTPMATPTATSVPTATPTTFFDPGTPGPLPGQNCAMLGIDNATFRDPNDWTMFNGATYASTDPNASLLLPPGSSAEMDISLNPAKQYTWQIYYRAQENGANGYLGVQIDDKFYQASMDGGTSEYAYTGNPATYSQGSGVLKLSRPLGDTGSLIVRYVCLAESTSGATTAPPVTGGTTTDGCVTCDSPLDALDIMGFINWLLCNIRNFFACWLLPALSFVLQFIGMLIQDFVAFVGWLLNGIETIFTVLATALRDGFLGILGLAWNAITGGSNALQTSGVASVINSTSRNIEDLPTILANEVGGYADQLLGIFHSSANLLDLLVRLIWLAISAIFRALELIPITIQALVSGLLSSGEPVSGSSYCSSPDSLLFYPCLGFYIMDNTIFQGPAKYMLPILTGLVGFDMITWTLNRIKEELSK
jgi:hypothetical protein